MYSLVRGDTPTFRSFFDKRRPLDAVSSPGTWVDLGHVTEAVDDLHPVLSEREGQRTIAEVVLYGERVHVCMSVPQASVIVLPDHLHHNTQQAQELSMKVGVWAHALVVISAHDDDEHMYMCEKIPADSNIPQRPLPESN